MKGPILVRTYDDVRLAAWTKGAETQPAVVLSHYLGGNAGGWSAQVEALASRFRVVVYDTRGHGASESGAAPYSVEMLGRDALSIMDHFGLRRVHFIGLSQGGMTAMWLGANHPARIDRLVLANTTPFIPNKPVWEELIAKARSEGLHDIAASTVLGWLSDAFKANHSDQAQALVETMRATSIVGYTGACAALRDVDLREDLGRIVAPALVIAGAEDGPRGAAASVIAQRVQSGALITIPEAAHLSHVENPNAFNDALLEHLR